jgi:hypothetical protein
MGRRHVRTEKPALRRTSLLTRVRVARPDNPCDYDRPSVNRKAPDLSGTYLLNRLFAASIHTGFVNRKARRWRTCLLKCYVAPTTDNHVYRYTAKGIRQEDRCGERGNRTPSAFRRTHRLSVVGVPSTLHSPIPTASPHAPHRVRMSSTLTSTKWHNIP